jgi:hypothetical protein
MLLWRQAAEDLFSRVKQCCVWRRQPRTVMAARRVTTRGQDFKARAARLEAAAPEAVCAQRSVRMQYAVWHM